MNWSSKLVPAETPAGYWLGRGSAVATSMRSSSKQVLLSILVPFCFFTPAVSSLGAVSLGGCSCHLWLVMPPTCAIQGFTWQGLSSKCFRAVHGHFLYLWYIMQQFRCNAREVFIQSTIDLNFWRCRTAFEQAQRSLCAFAVVTRGKMTGTSRSCCLFYNRHFNQTPAL